jgi:hypothetical protein
MPESALARCLCAEMHCSSMYRICGGGSRLQRPCTRGGDGGLAKSLLLFFFPIVWDRNENVELPTMRDEEV